MHPLEHLYYFSCLGPSFLVYSTPFAFMWNGVHLLISPAASHSGWEDHFQSDQYHYLHHRFFECNYGTSGTPLDKMFGTFRDKLKESGTSYRGGSEEKVDAKTVAIHDSKRGEQDERESYQSDQVPNILYRQDDLFEMKIPVKVSSVIEDLRIEILESSPINFTTSLVLKSFIVFSAVVIFLINSSIIRWDHRLLETGTFR